MGSAWFNFQQQVQSFILAAVGFLLLVGAVQMGLFLWTGMKKVPGQAGPVLARLCEQLATETRLAQDPVGSQNAFKARIDQVVRSACGSYLPKGAPVPYQFESLGYFKTSIEGNTERFDLRYAYTLETKLLAKFTIRRQFVETVQLTIRPGSQLHVLVTPKRQ
jgi:hypothetical protein